MLTTAKDGNVITLPDNNCPDYAGDSCGTYDTPDPQLTANSTQAAAPNMWKTLQGFMGAFPQYSRNSFHFTTESYGGHYGPVFNEYFETQNAAQIPGACNISLESVSLPAYAVSFLVLCIHRCDVNASKWLPTAKSERA